VVDGKFNAKTGLAAPSSVILSGPEVDSDTLTRRAARLSISIISYMNDHWRGHQSLSRAWWLNCIGVSAVLVGIGLVFNQSRWIFLVDHRGAFLSSMMLALIAYALIPLWQIVGLWRTTNHHMRHVGTILAGRSIQILASIFMLWLIIRALGLAGIVGPLIPAAFHFGPYTNSLNILAKGRELEVRGGLGPGIADKVEQLLLQTPTIRRIRLNSEAGGMAEARRLGHVIRRYQLNTYTTETCSGACPIAFLQGNQRTLRRSARIGFWLPPLQGRYLTTDQMPFLLRQKGVADWFIAQWKTTDGLIWYPPPQMLKAAGVINTLYGRATTKSPNPGLK
jgi:hypothetical protein